MPPVRYVRHAKQCSSGNSRFQWLVNLSATFVHPLSRALSSLSLAASPDPSPSLTHARALSVSLSPSLPPSLSLSLALSRCRSLSLSLSLALSHAHQPWSTRTDAAPAVAHRKYCMPPRHIKRTILSEQIKCSEPTFLLQMAPRLWFLVSDFGVQEGCMHLISGCERGGFHFGARGVCAFDFGAQRARV
eukprot:1611581-Rhodomonas_salina.1